MSANTTNYKVVLSGTTYDLNELFQVYTSGTKASTTNFIVNNSHYTNTDLKDIFQKYDGTSTKQTNTNLKSGSTDLSSIFQPIPFLINGSSSFTTSLTGGYYYIYFNSSLEVSNTFNISFINNFNASIIIVGGGGAGYGNGNGTGGGGGGASARVSSYTIQSGSTYTIVSGGGGKSQVGGGNGLKSSITLNSTTLILANGGDVGTSSAGGSGGSITGTLTYLGGSGGDGGHRSAGSNSIWYDNYPSFTLPNGTALGNLGGGGGGGINTAPNGSGGGGAGNGAGGSIGTNGSSFGGRSASNYGGGGGGCGVGTSTGSAGGSGGNGVVIIYFQYP